jgi:hypothetical protein
MMKQRKVKCSNQKGEKLPLSYTKLITTLKNLKEVNRIEIHAELFAPLPKSNSLYIAIN